MMWKAIFDQGVACFSRGDLGEALKYMSQAAELESNNFIIYDSRAAVYQKLGKTNAALRDSKRVIDLAPDRWQGYARAARLFHTLENDDLTIKMADRALRRMRSNDDPWRALMLEIREEAVAAQAAAKKPRLSQVVQTSYLLGKLPVEILVEIFTLLIDEDHTWAIRLSHVCGHWRCILVNTPSAWRTLVLSRKHPLRKVKLWKERTKNRIARVSLAIPELDRHAVFTELQDISWDALLSLCTTGEDLVKLYRRISNPHPFLKLEELTLFTDTSLAQAFRHLFGPDSKLKILRLSGGIHLMDEWWGWIQQLKELRLEGSIGRFSPLVFAANPSLEKFVVRCQGMMDYFYPEAGNSTALTSMHNLKTIECLGMDEPSKLLSTISAPSIMHFSIHSAMAADETLLRIAARPSLVELRITNCGLSPDTLPTLLSSTPNLEMLQVGRINAVVNDMFRFLTPKTVDQESGLPCRALKHVDVSQCADLTTSSVYAFVKTRVLYASESVVPVERCAAIESLQVDKCPKIEPDMLPWFRSKVAQFSCVYATRVDLMKHRGRYL